MQLYTTKNGFYCTYIKKKNQPGSQGEDGMQTMTNQSKLPYKMYHITRLERGEKLS